MSTGPYAQRGSEPGDGEAAQGLSGAAGQAQEKAQEFAGQAQQQAHQAAGQVRNRLREQLDERSSQAAEQINQQASDLRAVSSSLREQGKDGPAGAADKLADYGEKLGGYLNDRDSDRLLADLEDFGRRQPWAIAVGGLALGFAASRFLKASSSRRYSSRYGAQTPSPRGTGTGYTTPGGYTVPAAPSGGVSPSPTEFPGRVSPGYPGFTPAASTDTAATEAVAPLPPRPGV